MSGGGPDVAADADQTSQLADARRLLFEDRLSGAMVAIEALLAGELTARDRGAALILRRPNQNEWLK